jgi:cell division protein FtsB
VTNLTEVGQQAQPTPTEQKAKAKPKPTEKPLTPETKQAQPKVVPEEVTTKETAKTVEDAIKTDVTDPAFPTSTKHDSTKEIRERLGIGQVNSKTRRSDEEAMSEAVKRKIPEKAGRIADEINTTARALSDIEDAGMRVAVAELEIEHEQIMKLIAESKDDADIKTLSAEVNRIETEFDSIISALETSGTEAGRALRARKVQISRDFSLVAVLNRAKAAVGQKLGATKERLFKQLTDKLNKTTKRVEVLETEVNDLKALKIVGRGARRFTSMTTQQRQVSRKGLTTKLNELLAKGCNN